MVRKEEFVSCSDVTAAETSSVGCIGVQNQAAIMEACSVQILGITFEDSGWTFSSYRYVSLACAYGSLLHAAPDSDFTARMTRPVITLLLTKVHCYVTGRESTGTRRKRPS